MPPNDPASFARCLAPYLKVAPPDPAISSDEQRRAAERLLCILSIISSLLGKLDRLAPEAAQDLEIDLVQLINGHHYVQVSRLDTDAPKPSAHFCARLPEMLLHCHDRQLAAMSVQEPSTQSNLICSVIFTSWSAVCLKVSWLQMPQEIHIVNNWTMQTCLCTGSFWCSPRTVLPGQAEPLGRAAPSSPDDPVLGGTQAETSSSA